MRVAIAQLWLPGFTVNAVWIGLAFEHPSVAVVVPTRRTAMPPTPEHAWLPAPVSEPKATPIPPPPSSGVRLVVVAVEHVSDPRDRFRCEKMRSVLTAGGCVSMKTKADAASAGLVASSGAFKRLAVVQTDCRGCEVGARIATQVQQASAGGAV